jgi:hypothetical protein
VGKDEYYWGYASGVVATKVPGWGEFVLAEMTDTFDHSLKICTVILLRVDLRNGTGVSPQYPAEKP